MSVPQSPIPPAHVGARTSSSAHAYKRIPGASSTHASSLNKTSPLAESRPKTGGETASNYFSASSARHSEGEEGNS